MSTLSPPAELPLTPAVPSRTLAQVQTVATLYLAYATSMVLRMIPSVVGTAIRDETHLGIGLAEWSQVLAAVGRPTGLADG
jgi:hypothetical protein